VLPCILSVDSKASKERSAAFCMVVCNDTETHFPENVVSTSKTHGVTSHKPHNLTAHLSETSNVTTVLVTIVCAFDVLFKIYPNTLSNSFDQTCCASD
jgi:hypothetical protein